MKKPYQYITLGHGSGGRLTAELINRWQSVFSNRYLRRLEDSAVLPFSGKLAFTTDAFVVKPLFFPGGDIGSLAISGTVNDLSCVGAHPLYISVALIIEEGFPVSDLERIVRSAAKTAFRAGVKVVAGDTKVVNRGMADGLYITTSGCGTVPEEMNLGRKNIRKNDRLLVNGCLGEHAAAVMLARNEFSFSGSVKSDAAPLNGLVEYLLDRLKTVRFIRDITRGGLATVLAETAEGMNWGITAFEEKIPFSREVLAISGILGLDPLYFACEGRVAIVVAREESERALNLLRKHPRGRGARIIGEVTGTPAGKALLHTRVSGKRLLETLAGEQLPRIC